MGAIKFHKAISIFCMFILKKYHLLLIQLTQIDPKTISILNSAGVRKPSSVIKSIRYIKWYIIRKF